ncbi:MAG TPA: LysR family transcriptional regulator [Acetobacteraceae bacterium]|nr:LysR family transcriptional regulator [Acetobacteraceae bacterium]
MTEPFRGAVADADLRLLRVFRTVVEVGGYKAAELALNKGSPAISMDITALEQRLGLRLAVRGRAGFALTDAGRTVYAAALDLFEQIERFRDRVAAAAQHLSGRVTLMVVDNIVSVAADPLARVLGSFARRHPAVRLNVGSAPAGEVQRAVLDGEADFGVSVVKRPMEALAMRPLFRETLLLYCGRGNPLFDQAEIPPEQARAQPLVQPSVTDEPDFAASLATFTPGARADTLDARVLLILSGAFIGFLPPHYARAWVERGALREVLPHVFRAENTFHMLTRRGIPLGAAADVLRTSVLEAFDLPNSA